MSDMKNVAALFLMIFACTLDGYSMMDYRLSEKRSFACFAAISLFCFGINSYMAMRFGMHFLRNVILFTIGLPYFALILLITRDKISQTVFNFWLWINIYEFIAILSAFISDCTVKSYYFQVSVRLALLGGYFVLYNKLLRARHRSLMEKVQVNWWVFSFIPMSFTTLVYLVELYGGTPDGLEHNYIILLAIHLMMLFVYILIFYTFKTAYESMEKREMAQKMKEQVILQKKQYEFYLQKEEAERIFRHDARHRDTLLLARLDEGDIDGVRELLSREITEIGSTAGQVFCSNKLVNAVLAEYRAAALAKGVRFSASVRMPAKLYCDEAEFCVMLSNLLENSVAAAKKYIKTDIKSLNSQLLLSVENDYDGRLEKNAAGDYVTTKAEGSGLGLKSVDAILRKNGGFMKLDTAEGVFCVYASLRN